MNRHYDKAILCTQDFLLSMKCAERIEELRESVLKPTGQKDKRAELHSLKKNRSELPPSERSPITGEKRELKR